MLARVKPPELTGPRVTLRLGAERDAPEMVRFFAENNDFFARTQTPRTGEWLTESFWRKRFRALKEDLQNDRSCQMLVLYPGAERVIAVVNFTAFIRGYFQACYLGYLLAESEQGQGIMTEAAGLGINYVFSELDMHRIMANYAPSNEKSGRVLERLGFQTEGRAPDYLRINGVWTEHVMTALTNRNWRGKFI